jgi:NhaP-type Na+/H+ or K+/H+ antiporter
MEVLVLVVGLMLGAVVLVGIGDRLRLPWPALMVVLGVAVALVPGLPDGVDIDPALILPLFLPPLLYATAQRTSWSVFRARWRSILLLAVALVVATIAAVAGTAWLLVPGIGLTAAVALGAMVAPPDPVAVEAVAGPVRIPRRLLAVLQAEGLFNDATALVVFQAAILATVEGQNLTPGRLVPSFLLGAAAAVIIGLAVARLARLVAGRVTDPVSRSALTLVLPFAVYVAAEQVHASGVIAVVVLALETRSVAAPDESAARLVQRSFWTVVELLVTGIAFGLIGLQLRGVVVAAGPELGRMLLHALAVVGVVFAVRVVWMAGALVSVRTRPEDATRRADGVPGAVEEPHQLLAALRIATPVVLMGHSLGGRIAETFARAYPRAVAGLVSVDGTPTEFYQEGQRGSVAHRRARWLDVPHARQQCDPPRAGTAADSRRRPGRQRRTMDGMGRERNTPTAVRSPSGTSCGKAGNETPPPAWARLTSSSPRPAT